MVENFAPGTKQLINAPLPKSNLEIGNQIAIALMTTIYRAEGKSNLVSKLSDRLQFIIQNPPKRKNDFNSAFNNLKLAENFASQQKNDDAINHLTTAIDEGYILNWRTEILYNPVYSSLQNEPRFIKLLNRIETEMAQQLLVLDEYK